MTSQASFSGTYSQYWRVPYVGRYWGSGLRTEREIKGAGGGGGDPYYAVGYTNLETIVK